MSTVILLLIAGGCITGVAFFGIFMVLLVRSLIPKKEGDEGADWGAALRRLLSGLAVALATGALSAYLGLLASFLGVELWKALQITLIPWAVATPVGFFFVSVALAVIEIVPNRSWETDDVPLALSVVLIIGVLFSGLLLVGAYIATPIMMWQANHP